MEATPEDFAAWIREYGDRRYRDGYRDAIRELFKVREWLMRQQDKKWRQEVREWVDNLIEEMGART